MARRQAEGTIAVDAPTAYGGKDSEGPSRWAVAGALVKMLPLILCLALLGPVQWLANRFGWTLLSRRLPIVFHRIALACLDVRVRREGAPLAGGPMLLVGNHVSWLDIVMLSAVTPVRFISKDDVAGWPVFGTLARLQNTLFVSRTKRSDTAKMTAAMRAAFTANDRLVLFAEGTTSDGNQVLAFKPALLGAMIGEAADVPIQPFTLAYLRQDGLPLSLGQRAALGWYGDLDLVPSLLDIIHGGPLTVALVMGEPCSMAKLGGRKQAAATLHAEVRQTLARRLRQG